MSRWVGRDGLLMRPYRIAGRFVTLRRTYSWLQARLEPEAVDWPPPESLFPDFRPDACCAELGRLSVAPGPVLPENIVAAIRAFGLTALCHPPSDARPFRHSDVSAGYLLDDGPVPVGDVDRPETCPAINSLRRDPALLAVARGHLGYWPRHADARLYWSFVGAVADAARRDHGQTIDFHYDVPWFHAIYVYFYLTDTDRDSERTWFCPGRRSTSRSNSS